MTALPSYVRCLLLTLLVATGLTSVRAATFDYSYLFADGTSVTGSFEGTRNGGLVQDIANISLFINGVPTAGAIYAATFDESLFSWVTGAVVSFDALQSNFIFANDDLANGGFGYDAAFYLVNGTSFSDGAVALDLSQGLSGSEAVAPASWSLTPATASVPDTAATAALCAMGLFSMMLLRRRADYTA